MRNVANVNERDNETLHKTTRVSQFVLCAQPNGDSIPDVYKYTNLFIGKLQIRISHLSLRSKQSELYRNKLQFRLTLSTYTTTLHCQIWK